MFKKKMIPNIILYLSIYQYIENVKYVDANLWSILEKDIYIRLL